MLTTYVCLSRLLLCINSHIIDLQVQIYVYTCVSWMYQLSRDKLFYLLAVLNDYFKDSVVPLFHLILHEHAQDKLGWRKSKRIIMTPFVVGRASMVRKE